MYEGITPKENREFTTSLGNWTGDAAWNAGPVGGKSGLMQFTCPPLSVPQTATLLYPYAKPKNNIYNDVFLSLYFPSAPDGLIYTLFTITDGVYTFTQEWYYGLEVGYWLLAGIAADVPADWNQENTLLTFYAENPNAYEYKFYADDASIQAELAVRPDHLPLMGVH